jgi:hypothetical protein
MTNGHLNDFLFLHHRHLSSSKPLRQRLKTPSCASLEQPQPDGERPPRDPEQKQYKQQ